MKRSMRLFTLIMVILPSLACSTIDRLMSSSAAASVPTTGAGLPPATSAAVNPPAPSTDDWPTFVNNYHGFRLKYPPGGEILEEYDIFAHIRLPFTQGTTLRDKYLEVNVYTDANFCQSQEYGVDPSKTNQVRINGLDWNMEAGGSGGAGSFHEWIAYSTYQARTCVNLNFVMISIDSNMTDPPSPAFDRDSEKAVFAEIVSTFEWFGS